MNPGCIDISEHPTIIHPRTQALRPTPPATTARAASTDRPRPAAEAELYSVLRGARFRRLVRLLDTVARACRRACTPRTPLQIVDEATLRDVGLDRFDARELASRGIARAPRPDLAFDREPWL